MSVKRDMRARKDEELKKLLNYLNCKGQYANSTAYCKQFRLYKLIQMSNEITFFLLDESGVVSYKERYVLLSIIRYINHVIDAKTPSNKERLEAQLKKLETLISA